MQPFNSFDLSGMGEALPERGLPSQSHLSQQEPLRSASEANTSAGYPSSFHFPNQAPLANPGYSPLPPQYASPYQQAAANAQAYANLQPNPSAHMGGPNPIQGYPGGPFYQNQQSPYAFYSGHYGQPQQGASTPYIYPRSSNQPYGAVPPAPHILETAGMTAKHFGGYNPSAPDPYGYGSGTPAATGAGNVQGKIKVSINRNQPVNAAFDLGGRGSNLSRSSGTIPPSPRGPPRKPRQSGHALWVGNLPPGTQVVDLKDHFSREATKTIESVFLISKSNCAFVNYRTDDACAAAMTRFHDSRFQGVRLVCRLRRGAVAPASGVPTGPAAAQSHTAIESITHNREVSSRAEAQANNAEAFGENQTLLKAVDKYFIVKSLTVEDMELSVRNSIWATQAHNEEALNKAYNVSQS